MKRILLKCSGEFLREGGALWSPKKLQSISWEVKQLQAEGIQVALVIGGGNLFRGERNDYALDRLQGDEVGMAATCVNGLFLKAVLQGIGLSVALYGTFLKGGSIVPLNVEEARRQLDHGAIVVFTGGTGSAFFSTDTAAALRALEMRADALLKATNVDGVYDKDPKKFPDAKRFEALTYQQALEGRYAVMDACAFALCREQQLPIFIFNVNPDDAIVQAVHRQALGTWIRP